MELPQVEDFQGLIAYAMVRAPRFNPEDGRDSTAVLSELRRRHAEMQQEWWGGKELYALMQRHLQDAERRLESGDVLEAKRAWGKIYAIINETPMNATRH